MTTIMEVNESAVRNLTDAESYKEWLELRDDHRQRLFNEEPLGHTEITPSLGSLALHTDLGVSKGAPTLPERIAKQELELGVEAILQYHHRISSSQGKGVFALLDPERDMPALVAVTARTVSLWEKACRRQKIASPFMEMPIADIDEKDLLENTAAQLIVESASAVIELVQNGYVINRNNFNSHGNMQLARFIAQRGPKFAVNWMNGSIIREYCESNGYDADEWLSTLTAARRAYIAVNNIANPLTVTIQKMNHLTMTLSSENLSALLGWELDKVNAVFTTSARNTICFGSADPIKKVCQIAERLDVALATENLEHELGWNTERVDNVFSSSARLQIALTSKDPIARARTIANNFDTVLTTESIMDRLGWPHTKVNELFTSGMRKHIAFSSTNAGLVVQKIADCYMHKLTDEMIMAKTGLTERQVKSLFLEYRRQEIAKHNYANPHIKTVGISKLYRELSQLYELSPNILAALAFYSKSRAHRVASQVKAELENVPKGVSEAAWAWSYISNPSSSAEERLNRIAEYRLWLKIHNATSLDTGLWGEPMHDKVPDLAKDFSDNLASNTAGKLLVDIADMAGVTKAQLRQLLERFRDEDESEMADLQPILNRLRRVV